MTTNGMNTSEDVEMEGDGEKVVTMMDVLREQQDFEEDANAVLGASDDKNCTYSKGYVKRQAIYACLTCCPEAVLDPSKRAGVCLACSLACHENHELVELYTKRNFRCDCGNPKFTHPCQFTPNKTELNYENKYNQNFSGIYCNCKRPYPDPECAEEEEMIQCIVCEDWLHVNHLEATVPNNDQYAEMICKDCMEDIDFLHDYSELVVNTEDKEIIVMDPDLDVSSMIKAKEISKKEELSNGIAEVDHSKEKVESLLDHIDNIVNESVKEKDKILLDNIDSIVNEKDKTADVDMSTGEPDKSEEALAENPQTEKSSDTAANESNKDLETDNKEKNEEDTSPEIDKKSDENATDQNSETEKVVDAKVSETEKAENESDDVSDKPNVTETTGIEAEKIQVDMETETEAKDHNTETEAKDDNTKTEAKDDNTETEAKDDNKEIEANDDTETKAKDDNTVTTTNDVSADVDKVKETKDSTAEEIENSTNTNEHKRRLSDEGDEVSPKKQKLDLKPCVRPRGVKRVYKGSTFWPSNLRQKLCTCTECLAMYKDLAVLFLTDPEDTVAAYEALGKENIDGAPSSQYEKGLKALSSLDRVQQINALTEYNKMRDRLLDFLKSFKDRKEVVKEEDIKEFFAGMKPKREPDGVYFCR